MYRVAINSCAKRAQFFGGGIRSTPLIPHRYGSFSVQNSINDIEGGGPTPVPSSISHRYTLTNHAPRNTQLTEDIAALSHKKFTMPVPFVELAEELPRFTYIAYCVSQSIDMPDVMAILPRMAPAPWANYGVDIGVWPGTTAFLHNMTISPQFFAEKLVQGGTAVRADMPVVQTDTLFASVRPSPEDDPNEPTDMLSVWRFGSYVFWAKDVEGSALRGTIAESTNREHWERAPLIKPIIIRSSVSALEIKAIFGHWLTAQGLHFDPSVPNPDAHLPPKIVLEMRLDLSRIFAVRSKIFALRQWILELDGKISEIIRQNAHDGTVSTNIPICNQLLAACDMIRQDLDILMEFTKRGPTQVVGNLMIPTDAMPRALEYYALSGRIEAMTGEIESMRDVVRRCAENLDRSSRTSYLTAMVVLWGFTILAWVLVEWARTLREALAEPIKL